jgi:hypothetical protein
VWLVRRPAAEPLCALPVVVSSPPYLLQPVKPCSKPPLVKPKAGRGVGLGDGVGVLVAVADGGGVFVGVEVLAAVGWDVEVEVAVGVAVTDGASVGSGDGIGVGAVSGVVSWMPSKQTSAPSESGRTKATTTDSGTRLATEDTEKCVYWLPVVISPDTTPIGIPFGRLKESNRSMLAVPAWTRVQPESV